MSPDIEALSETERRVLDFILSYHELHGREPSWGEIKRELEHVRSIRQRSSPSISHEEWQRRTARVERERKELKERRVRRFGQYRRIYERYCGPIPKGYHVHHRDGNHRNNNPRNLQAVTPRVHRMKHTLLGQNLPVIDSKARLED